MPSTKAKQDWLISKGKPKSYSYFMTGPNMGPEWDWDAALAGSYSSATEEAFLADGQTAYNAGKAKSKVKKVAGNPLTPSTGPAANCAKSAAKAISTWVAEAVDNANLWYVKIGAQVHKGTPLGVSDNADSFIKAAKKHRNAAISELGEQADEVAGLQTLIDLMDDVERARLSAADLSNVTLGWGSDDVNNAVLGLDALKAKADNVHDYLLGKAAPLFDDFDDPVGVLTLIKANADDVVLQNQQIAVGRTWQKIAVDQAAEWDDLAFVPTALADSPFTVANQVVLRIELLGEIDGAGLLEAIPIIEGQKRLARIAAMWQKQINPFDADDVSLAIAHSGIDLMGDAAKALRNAADNHIKAYIELLDNYADADWWVTSQTSGLLGDLTNSPLEHWAKKYGNNAPARLIQEAEEMNNLAHQLATDGAFTAFQSDIVAVTDEITGLVLETLDVLETSLNAAKSKLPGLTATKDEVLAALDPSFKSAILEAGTDDLNDLLGTQLVEVDENKSLLYYMTKEQKQDFILLPKEVFDNVEYSIKYKGDVLQGKGLTTAKTKLAAKKGKQAVATPAAQEAAAPTTLIDTITGATEQYTIPPGSKKWWADSVSDAQTTFLGNEMASNTSLSAAWSDAGAGELVKAGKLTKGQASQVISQVKGGKTTWTADEISKAMNYGQPIKVTAMDDVVKAVVANVIDPDASDIAAAVQAVEQGGAVAGTVTKTSKAAAKHIDWDAPHTYTYVGDGSKWGGAHRKWHFVDEDGADWMLKHGAPFRAEGELAAHRVGNAVGFDVAEARVTTQRLGTGGRETGFMQRMYRKDEIKGELADHLRGGSFVGLDDDIVRQVQEHQVLDWLIGNQDGHAQNFLIMRDGRVVGIDKGQAFKFMGQDSLSATYKPPGNFGEIVYNRMWREYGDGLIDLDLDTIDAVLRRIEALSDSDYRKMIVKYADGRFSAGARAGSLGTTSANTAEELVDLALDRKRTIRRDFTAFYQENAKQRGITWNPAWQEVDVAPKAAKKAVKKLNANDILTPIDEDFVAALDRAGTAGKSIYVSGSDAERGQILFDVVLDSNGDEVLRGTVILRPDADERLLKVFADEGGEKLAKKSSVPAATGAPSGVAESQAMGLDTVKGAKTVNYHISQGDFDPNKTQIAKVQSFLDQAEGADTKFVHITNVDSIADDVLQSKVDELAELLDGAELDAALETFVNQQAADATLLKTMRTYEPHWKEIVDEAAKGNLAKKVGKVPDFPSTVHYEQVKADALKRARTFSSSAKAVQHVEVIEPDKLFTKITYKTNSTSTIKVGSGARRASLESDLPIQIRGNAYFASTDEGVDLIYREISGSSPTHQGWLELSMTTDGKVTQADIETMYSVIRTKVGMQVDLATTQDMELTYWRVVTGTYRNSVEGASSSSAYSKAIREVDVRVRALGPNPTPAKEIDAIRGAWRAQFGRQIDDADFLPIHNHALSQTADEIGWGYLERPELGDLSIDLSGKVVVHSTTYGDGRVRAELIEGATGDSMMSQARRQQFGFKASAKSASQDLDGGGAAGLFTRIKRDTDVGANAIVMNPARVHRKLGNYNAEGDTYGRLRDRTSRNTLSAKRWAGQARTTNETMIRDGASWMDDVEIAFFGTKTEADLAIRTLADRGITSIRGVPVAERFVSVPSPGQYTHTFFQERVGRAGFAARLRRSVDEILETGRAVTAQVKAEAGRVVSRLKTRTFFTGKVQLTKKLSAGRPGQVFVTSNPTTLKPGKEQITMAVRYHNNENAVTVAFNHFLESGAIVFDEAALPGAVGSLELGMKQLGVTNWSKTVETKFKFRRRTFTGDGVVIDLAPYGIDLKNVSQYQRPQLLREFVQALISNTLDDFSVKWAGIAA